MYTLDEQAMFMHDCWSVWMQYYFSLTEEQRKAKYDDWKRLMNTRFWNLTDKEKASDYEVAEKVFWDSHKIYKNPTNNKPDNIAGIPIVVDNLSQTCHDSIKIAD